MKKQESIYFHRIKHNILGGFSMGLFGKSKKEIEREEIEKLNQKYDKMIDLLTKQNELLTILAENSKTPYHSANMAR